MTALATSHPSSDRYASVALRLLTMPTVYAPTPPVTLPSIVTLLQVPSLVELAVAHRAAGMAGVYIVYVAGAICKMGMRHRSS